MPITVTYPGMLRKWFDGLESVSAQGETVALCLAYLEPRFPGLEGRLRTAAVLVNGRDIRLLQGLATPLHDGDRIELIPLLAGG
jgi:molybdopterin converting factor small subunit